MSEGAATMNEAVALEKEAIDNIEAAQGEQQSGRPAMSLGLLKDAIEKERAGLDLLSDSVETLRRSVEQRRHALDEQAEIVEQVIRELTND